MAIKAGAYDLVLAVGVEQMGKRAVRRRRWRQRHPDRRPARSGTMPAVFAEAGMEHRRKYGTIVRAVREGVGEEPQALDAEPEGHVPDRDAAREGDERRDDRLPEHALMCCPTATAPRRRSSVGGEGQGARQKRVRVSASVLTSDPWTERDLMMPDVNTSRGTRRSRPTRRRASARRTRPGRAARLLRDRRAAALREPRSVRRRRGRPDDRRGRRRRSADGSP